MISLNIGNMSDSRKEITAGEDVDIVAKTSKIREAEIWEYCNLDVFPWKLLLN